MRGRKPIPTHLKLVNGNPGRRPITPDGFRPLAEIPDCPEHLQGEGRKEWDRITALLDEHAMIAQVDRGALSMLCTVWARYVNAEEMIEKARQAAPASMGLFVKSPNDFPIQSPWLAVSNRAMEQYRALCDMFGLSPSARARIEPATSQMNLPGVEQLGPDRFFAK